MRSLARACGRRPGTGGAASPAALLALLPILLCACGDSSRPVAPDPGGPEPVADLRVTAFTDSTVTLAWTAPGVAGDSTGGAAAYELRYHTRLLDERTWGKARAVDSLAAPGPAGTTQSCIVTGLAERTTYYVGIRSADAEGRWSGLSNIVRTATPASAPAVLWEASKLWFGEGSYPTEVAFSPDGRLYFSYNDQSLASRRGYTLPRVLYLYDPASGVEQYWKDQDPGSWPGLALVPGGGFYTWDYLGIVKLDTDLNRVAHFGVKDWLAPGTVGGVSDVAVDEDGFVYAACRWHSRIQKFTADGTFVAEWACPHPKAIALDGRGRLYVRGEYPWDRIGIYTTDGDSLGEARIPGARGGLGTDRDGNLYVAGDGEDYLFITELSPELEILNRWPLERRPIDVAVDADGNLYVLSFGSPSVTKLSREGVLMASWHAGGANLNSSINWAGISVAANGDVFVAAENFNAVRRYSPDGALLADWGMEGMGAGKFRSPVAVAPTGDGTVYVADYINVRIQIFDWNGVYISSFGNETHDDWVATPADLALDSQGNVYVADRGYQRIQKYGPGGEFLATWGKRRGSGPGEFDFPRGIAVDGQDRVYVWDTLNHRVQVFDANGAFLQAWPAVAGGKALEPATSVPAGIAVDAAGTVYLADRVNHRIVAFSGSGVVLGEWGGLGSERGRLNGPGSLTVGPEGQICVVDHGNKRLQTFANPDYPRP